MKKYRVFNKASDGWIHGPGNEINLIGEVVLLGHFLDGVSIKDLNSIVVLEYTGIVDRRGHEIYEGDKICIENTDPTSCAGNDICTVEYHGSCWCYVDNNKPVPICNYIGLAAVDVDCEVIGNIFDID